MRYSDRFKARLRRWLDVPARAEVSDFVTHDEVEDIANDCANSAIGDYDFSDIVRENVDADSIVNEANDAIVDIVQSVIDDQDEQSRPPCKCVHCCSNK
jgi:hypothetical protein